MMARRFLLLGFAAALMTAVGCGGGDGGGTPPPALVCADGGAASANAVTLACGGTTNPTTEQIDVVIGGPTMGTTSLRGLNFDVTYDPAELTFVSATAVSGGPFSASALLAAMAFPLDPVPHVVVSIQQVSGDPDVAIDAGQQVVLLHLTFAIASSATTVPPTPLDFDGAASEATPLAAAVSFGSSLTLSYQ